MAFGKLGAMGRGFGTFGALGGAAVKVVVPTGPFRPLAFTKAAPFMDMNSPNTQTGANTHHVCYSDVSDGSFQVWYPNYRVNVGSGEQGNGVTAIGRCSIMWIDQNKVQRITRLYGANGSPTVSAAPMTWFKFYAPANSPVRPLVGSHFWLTFWGSWAGSSTGGFYSQGRADTANGDHFQFGSSVPDLTGTATAYTDGFAAGGSYYGPDFIGGNRSVVTGPTWVNDCDSRESGIYTGSVVNDVADNLVGAYGTLGRLLVPYMAGINISVAGETASEMSDPTKCVMRDTLAAMCDYRATGYGGNDIIFQSKTAAQVTGWEATRKARLGLPTIYKTIDPITNGSNVVFSSANDPQRLSYNTSLRAIGGTYDPPAYLENGSTGTWGNYASYTADGTHETATGNKLVLSSASYNVGANFTGATLLNAGFQYPSGAIYQSLTFSDSWTLQQASITRAAIYGPEHKFTGCIFQEDGSSAPHNLIKQLSIGVLASATRTFTFFTKRVVGSRNIAFQLLDNGFGSAFVSVINLTDGTNQITFQRADLTAASVNTTMFDDYYKVVVQLSFNAAWSTGPFLNFQMASGTSTNYLGDNTSSNAVWGFNIT